MMNGVQMKECIQNTWSSLLGYRPKVSFMVNGWFRFHFLKEEDATNIVAFPSFKGRGFLVLQNWKVEFDIMMEVPKRKNIWAKLPGLPIELWTNAVIQEFSYKIGKLYYVDEGCMRLLDEKAAWFLVEVNLGGGLPEEIDIFWEARLLLGVVKVNPLCGQRRSLLAQAGSSNNQTMLTRRFLIANQR